VGYLPALQTRRDRISAALRLAIFAETTRYFLPTAKTVGIGTDETEKPVSRDLFTSRAAEIR
jgi:hypothetical protein